MLSLTLNRRMLRFTTWEEEVRALLGIKPEAEPEGPREPARKIVEQLITSELPVELHGHLGKLSTLTIISAVELCRSAALRAGTDCPLFVHDQNGSAWGFAVGMAGDEWTEVFFAPTGPAPSGIVLTPRDKRIIVEALGIALAHKIAQKLEEPEPGASLYSTYNELAERVIVL